MFSKQVLAWRIERALAALKDMTSHLIGRFVIAVEQATRAEHGPEPLTRHGGRLVVPRRSRAEGAVLKAESLGEPTGAEIWFCGPSGLADALRQGIHAMGWRPRFHQEAFEMR